MATVATSIMVDTAHIRTLSTIPVFYSSTIHSRCWILLCSATCFRWFYRNLSPPCLLRRTQVCSTSRASLTYSRGCEVFQKSWRCCGLELWSTMLTLFQLLIFWGGIEDGPLPLDISKAGEYGARKQCTVCETLLQKIQYIVCNVHDTERCITGSGVENTEIWALQTIKKNLADSLRKV